MIHHERFSPHFTVTIVEGSAAPVDFRFAAAGSGARAVELVVEPRDGPAWTAAFAAPDPGFPALTGVLGTPNPTGLCVIERGTAFVGDVLDPASFRRVETRGPVVGAEELPRCRTLVLLTPWSITALGPDGCRWTSGRIAVDRLRVDEAGDGWLRGVADPDDEEPRDFALDLSTGEVIGGAGIA